MSNVIDERVVSMKFDNANFEKNAKESIETLSQLNKALDNTESAKGLEGISAAASKVDLSGIASSIDAISNRFSTIGIIGGTIISRLTNSAIDGISSIISKVNNLASSIFNMMKNGGINRAMNIEKAKFQLEGLGVAYEDVYDAIDYAVTDTAYSLDAAAQAASQLASSGLDYKTEQFTHSFNGTTKSITNMGMALKAISGVAAQTQSDYSMVARYFQDIANAGKVTGATLTYMTQVLNLPVKSNLVEGLNAITDGAYDCSEAVQKNVEKITKGAHVTIADIDELVKDGLMDFETFSTIMFNKYADHAAEANRTLNGVSDNIKAAFSRIGADFAQPLIANDGPLVHMLDALRINIKNLKSVTSPVAKSFTDFAIVILNTATNLLKFNDSMNFVNVFKGGLETIANLFKALKDGVGEFQIGWILIDILNNINVVLGSIKSAFKEVFPPIEITADAIRNFVSNISNAVKASRLSDESAENLKRTFKGLFAIFDIGKQIISALLTPVKALFGAFSGNGSSSILAFTGTLGDWLVVLDNSLKEMGIFEEAGNRMASAVLGIKSIFDQLIDTVKNIISSWEGFNITSVVNILIASLDALASAVTVIFGSIFKIDVSSALKSIHDFFNNFNKSIHSFIDGIAESGFGDAIKRFFTKIKEAFAEGLGIDTSAISSKFNGLKESLTDLSGIGEVVGKAFAGLMTGLSSAMEMLKKVGGFVKTVITGIVDSIRNLGSQANLDFAKDVFNTGSLIVTVEIITTAVRKLDTLIGDIKGLIKGVKAGPVKGSLFNDISRTLGSLRSTLAQLQDQIRVNVIKELATAVLILAGACLVMASIDADKLGAATAAVAGLFAELAASMKILGSGGSASLKEVFTGGKDLSTLANTMIKLSVAVLILASAVKKLSDVDPQSMITGLLGVSALLWELVGVVKVLSTNQAKMISGATSIIAMALAVSILSKSVKTLGDMDILSLLKGVGAVAALIMLLGIVAVMTKSVPNIKMGTGLAIIGMAAGILILANACEKLSEIKFTSLVKAIGAVAALTLILASFAVIASDVGGLGIIAASLGLISFAVALDIMIPALQALAKIPWTSLAKVDLAIGGLLAIISVFGAIATLTGVGLVVGAAGLLVMGVALMTFIPTIHYLANMKGSFAKALGCMTALLAITELFGIIGLIAGPGMIVSAIGLMGMAKALAALTAVLVAMSAVSGREIGIMAAALGTLVGIGILATLAIVGFAGLAMVMTAIGIGAAGIGAGVLLAAAGLGLLVTALEGMILIAPEAAASIKTLIDGVITAIRSAVPNFIATIVEGFAAFLERMAQALPSILESTVTIISSIIMAVCEAIQTNAPVIIDTIFLLLDTIISRLAEYVPKFVDMGIEIITSLLNVLADRMPDFIQSGIDLIVNFATGITRAIPQLIQAGFEAIISLLIGIGDAVHTYMPLVIDAFWYMVDNIILALLDSTAEFVNCGMQFIVSIVDGFMDNIDKIKQCGKDCWQALKDSLSEGFDQVWEGAKNLGVSVLNGLSEALDWHSPPGEIIKCGDDITDALADTLEKGSNYVEKAADKLGNSVIDGLGLDDKTKHPKQAIKELVEDYKKAQGEGEKATSNFIKQFKSAEEAQAHFAEQSEESTDILDKLAQAMGISSEKTDELAKSTKGAAKEQKSLQETLEDTITKSMDIFKAFDAKTDLTADKLLENMKSQIDGVAYWAKKMNDLGTRGIDQGLLDKLAELGPQGYEYVNAFTQMTAEQLAQASVYFQQSLTLPKDAAAQALSGGKDVGTNLGLGLISGVNEQQDVINAECANAMGEGLQAMRDEAGIASPAKKTIEMGEFLMSGLITGMSHNFRLVITQMEYVCMRIIAKADGILTVSNFSPIGANVIEGLAQGIESKQDRVYGAIESVCSGLIDKAMKALQEHSPSKIFFKIGTNVDYGMANGIDHGATRVFSAIEEITDETISIMTEVISTISDMLDSDMDYNPTITPVVDLSNVRSGVMDINAAFSNGVSVSARNAQLSSYSKVSTEVGGAAVASAAGNNFNFIQNNYSPKALSRVDIYRQTKNQFSQMKGMVSAT